MDQLQVTRRKSHSNGHRHESGSSKEGPKGGSLSKQSPTPKISLISRKKTPETRTPDGSDKFRTLFLKCTIDDCLEFFINQADLSSHLDAEHRSGPLRCPRPHCFKSFYLKSRLSSHLEMAHFRVDWHCSKCKLRFNKAAAYTRHHHLHHYEGHFACTVKNCPYTAKYRAMVLTHFKRH